MDYFDQLTRGNNQSNAQQTLSNANASLGSQNANMRNKIMGIAQQKKAAEEQEAAATQGNWSRVWQGMDKIGGTMSAAGPHPAIKGAGFAMQLVGALGSAIQGMSQMGD